MVKSKKAKKKMSNNLIKSKNKSKNTNTMKKEML